MNHNELDEMLDQWKAPEMRNSLRETLRAGFAGTRERANRTGLLRRIIDAAAGIRISRLAVITMGAAALLFAIIQVSPQTVRMASPGYRIPFYVEFEFERYADNGSVPHQSRITSFPYAGHEIVMSVTESGDSLLTAIRGFASSIRTQFILAMPSLVLPKEPPMAEPDWFAAFVSSGCANGKTVVGHETLAGHETTVVQTGSPGHRMRISMAPDLACFALKLTDEIQEPNGTYVPRLRKEAIKVTVNR
jgi:hypothetical protein